MNVSEIDDFWGIPSDDGRKRKKEGTSVSIPTREGKDEESRSHVEKTSSNKNTDVFMKMSEQRSSPSPPSGIADTSIPHPLHRSSNDRKKFFAKGFGEPTPPPPPRRKKGAATSEFKSAIKDIRTIAYPHLAKREQLQYQNAKLKALGAKADKNAKASLPFLLHCRQKEKKEQEKKKEWEKELGVSLSLVKKDDKNASKKKHFPKGKGKKR